MTIEVAVELYREALRVAATVALPVLGSAMVVGLTVSVFQTVTSINDQTLTFIPKIAAIALTVAILIPWILAQLIEFLRFILVNAPGLVLAQ